MIETPLPLSTMGLTALKPAELVFGEEPGCVVPSMTGPSQVG